MSGVRINTDVAVASVESGTLAGQTLRWNGTAWVPNSNLWSDGTNVGVGISSSLDAKLHVKGDGGKIARFDNAAGSERVRITATGIIEFLNTTNLYITPATNSITIGTGSSSRSVIITGTADNVFHGDASSNSLILSGRSNQLSQVKINATGGIEITNGNGGGSAICEFKSAVAGNVKITVNASGDLVFSDAINIQSNATTGTKIGTATNQKFSFWNKTPIIQPTTAITGAAFVANTSGIVDDTATFGGYTIGKVVAALISMGILA